MKILHSNISNIHKYLVIIITYFKYTLDKQYIVINSTNKENILWIYLNQVKSSVFVTNVYIRVKQWYAWTCSILVSDKYRRTSEFYSGSCWSHDLCTGWSWGRRVWQLDPLSCSLLLYRRATEYRGRSQLMNILYECKSKGARWLFNSFTKIYIFWILYI